MTQITMEKIVALAKNRGFVYSGSEIYGGLANAWDYGPLGVELKNNVKKAWWDKFVRQSEHNVGIDCAILMNRNVWVASGHIGNFADPLTDCKECKTRYRADQIAEEYAMANGESGFRSAMSNEELYTYITDKKVPCPGCGKSNFTPIRQFNMMFKTYQGVTDDSKAEIFLRPETAQGIFVNFRNVQRTTRRKIPFGVGQVGKAFRNEITPGNFTFRTREFEQMELEFFCQPGTDLEWFDYWKDFCHKWLIGLGIKQESLRLRDHDKSELSHYSNATTDIEFKFPFGWGELWGIADRTDFDLKQHMEHSKEDLTYFDPETRMKYVPYCIEPSLGADRAALAFLCDAYDEEKIGENDTRCVLHFHNAIAPVKIALLPLSKKLGENSYQIYKELSRDYACEYDDAASIGKRYRRQDEIGTPFCVTFDFDSLDDKKVTVRERDSMEQVRIPVEGLSRYFAEKFIY